MDRKLIIQPIKHQVFAVLLMIAVLISNFKPNISHLTADQIAKDIVDKGGVFNNVENYKNNVSSYGGGNIVVNRVVSKYKIGE